MHKDPQQTAIPAVIDDLLHDCEPLAPDTTATGAIAGFRHQPATVALPVVSGDRLVGNLHSNSLHSPEVHSTGWRVQDAMSTECPVIVSGAQLVEVCRMIRNRQLSLDHGYLAVVTKHGRYKGMVRAVDLMRQISRFRIDYERYNNPLSQLPGPVPIDETIDRLLQARKLFVVVHCDINDFKGFNDAYGYARGDDVILFIAALLQSHVDPELDFVGHTRDDDFVIVFQSPDWFERCEAMERECTRRAPEFYSDAHRANHGIDAVDRMGRRTFHPFFSLSLGAVQVEPGKFSSHHEVTAAAIEVKQRAKRTAGGAIYIDERSYSQPDTQHPMLRH